MDGLFVHSCCVADKFDYALDLFQEAAQLWKEDCRQGRLAAGVREEDIKVPVITLAIDDINRAQKNAPSMTTRAFKRAKTWSNGRRINVLFTVSSGMFVVKNADLFSGPEEKQGTDLLFGSKA
jgi:hypothetical protein